MRKAWILAAFALLATGGAKSKPKPHAAKSSTRYDFARHLGAVHLDHTRKLVCFDLPSLAVAEGTRVTVVSLATPQSVAEATIAGLCPISGLNEVLLDGTPVSSQEIRWTNGEPPRFSEGIGVLGGAKVSIKDEHAFSDLDGDGALESFADCPSGEGAHATVWTGEPKTGTRRWHGYIYLGMDLEPACTDSETRP